VWSAKLVEMLQHCTNVVWVSLPTTKLNTEQLEMALRHMMHLKKLDILWDNEIVKVLTLVGSSLNELTINGLIYIYFCKSNGVPDSMGSWLDCWKSKGFVPQHLNITMTTHNNHLFKEDMILKEWHEVRSSLSPSHLGYLKLYKRFKMPLSLNTPVLPVFQMEFSRTATLPYVTTSKFGLLGLDRDLLLLTDVMYGGKVFHKASLKQKPSIINEDYLSHRINSLEFVTEFDVSFGRFIRSKFVSLNHQHLVQLSVACPNLQRLNLEDNYECLRNLVGIRAIANSCFRLEGLNLLHIPVKEVENQILLWQILNTMKLTHLAVDMCVLIPSNIEVFLKSVTKCTTLLALESESRGSCSDCRSKFVRNSLLMLSHFPSLIHYINHSYICYHKTALLDILRSCKKLKCLVLDQKVNPLLNPGISFCSLQQLCINSWESILPYTFMTMISAHGGLVHVVFNVYSIDTKGVSALVMNSPELMTLHYFVDRTMLTLHDELKATLKVTLSQRKLFTSGSFKVYDDEGYMSPCEKDHYSDLMSFWSTPTVL